MPVLGEQIRTREAEESFQKRRNAVIFPACVNPHCTSGWLHLWRSRSSPVIEDGWSCSPGCTRAWIAELVHRERMGQSQRVAMHRHRVPIGLVLLTEGWISHSDLRKALDAQRAGASVRIGAWLMEHCGLEERRITQALGIQWNCPILTIGKEHKTPEISLVPRIFLETFGILPLRLSSAGVLYVAFEDRIDHSLTLSLERMTGLRVEAGLVSCSEFLQAQKSILAARFPRTRLVEASSNEAIIDALTAIVEKEKPLQARIVRVHSFYWLRLWWKNLRGSPADAQVPSTNESQDIVCSLARFQ